MRSAFALPFPTAAAGAPVERRPDVGQILRAGGAGTVPTIQKEELDDGISVVGILPSGARAHVPQQDEVSARIFHEVRSEFREDRTIER